MLSDDAEHAVVVPIEGSLDLHTFQPRVLNELLDDYLEAASGKGFKEVLIIHGKGQGVLKKRVQAILKRHPLIVTIRQADEATGGWGATVAVLKAVKTD